MSCSPARTASLPAAGSSVPNFPGLSDDSNLYPKASCTSWWTALLEAASDVAIRPSQFAVAPTVWVKQDRAAANSPRVAILDG